MDENLDWLRQRLAERLDSCWDRLDDAVSELIELHDVPLEEIVDRVERFARLEGGSG